MRDNAKGDVEGLPNEDVNHRSSVPDVHRDDETSHGGDNSGTDLEPHREKITPDLDPDMTD
jgi:hypothetical protein